MAYFVKTASSLVFHRPEAVRISDLGNAMGTLVSM